MTDSAVSPDPHPRRARIALDAGQSGARARVLTLDGDAPAVLADVHLDPVITDHPVVPQLADRARQAANQVWPGDPSGRPPLELAVGSTGLSVRETADDLLARTAAAGFTRVALAHDSIICHLGALGGDAGAVVAAGTGVVTLAVGPGGLARVDGWGNQLGDAGSGFWIGRTGLRAVLRAYDGRGPATALTDVVRADFPDLEDAYLVIQSDPAWVKRVARYAKAVADLAPTDAVCAHVIRRAAGALAMSAMTALRRSGELGDPDGPAVSLTGKLFGSDVLREQFIALVREQAPSARFVAPQGDALDGAVALSDLAPTHPLASQVRRAG